MMLLSAVLTQTLDTQKNLPPNNAMGGAFVYTVEYSNSCEEKYILDFRNSVSHYTVDSANDIYFVQFGINPHNHAVAAGECNI